MNQKPEQRHHFRIEYTDRSAPQQLAHHIQHLLSRIDDRFDEVVVLCIGTDRSTGDSLGPIVGSKLHRLSLPHIRVFGTLDHPVHAVNLEDTMEEIEREHKGAPVIAIDACLGQLSHVGKISLLDGPLKPGAAVKKNLPEVGHFHITGIVNIGGFMEYFVLQNTRLGIIMKMAGRHRFFAYAFHPSVF